MAKILLVDDDGFEVAVAVDGQLEYDKTLEFKPDVILLDIMMPNVNGLEMLEKLKSNQATKKIPVILLTNVGGSEEDVDKGLNLGAVAYMIKAHYDSKGVVKKVKEILGGYVNELPKVEVIIKDEEEKNPRILEEIRKAKIELEKVQKKVEEITRKPETV